MSLGEQLSRFGIHWRAGQLIQEAIFVDSQATVTCTGNNSQANAAQLSATINVIDAGATTNSAKLPAIATYSPSYCVVRNSASGNNAYLFPYSGQRILGLATDGALTMASSTSKMFFKHTATEWLMVG